MSDETLRQYSKWKQTLGLALEINFLCDTCKSEIREKIKMLEEKIEEITLSELVAK